MNIPTNSRSEIVSDPVRFVSVHSLSRISFGHSWNQTNGFTCFNPLTQTIQHPTWRHWLDLGMMLVLLVWVLLHLTDDLSSCINVFSNFANIHQKLVLLLCEIAFLRFLEPIFCLPVPTTVFQLKFRSTRARACLLSFLTLLLRYSTILIIFEVVQLVFLVVELFEIMYMFKVMRLVDVVAQNWFSL